MADGADIQGIAGGGQMPDVSGTSWEAQTTQDRVAMLQAKRQNMALSLLAAGLGMMAARPGPGKGAGARAIAEGALTGLDTYSQGARQITQEEQNQQQARALMAYRNALLRNQQAEIGLRQQTAQTGQEAVAERRRHDEADEQAAAYRTQLLAQRNAIENLKANAETTRARAEADRAEADIAPVNRDVLARYRGTNVDKVLMLPDPETVMAMPKPEADRLLRDVISSYSRAVKSPHLPAPRYMPMGDGKIHKLWTDADGNSHDDIVGPAVTKGSASRYMAMGDGKIHKLWTDADGNSHDEVVGPAVIRSGSSRYMAMGDGKIHKLWTDADGKTHDEVVGPAAVKGESHVPAPRYVPMGDGKIHKLWTDASGKSHDEVVGPAVMKGDARSPAARYIPMGDGMIHKLWTDAQGKSHNEIVGPAVIRRGGSSRTDDLAAKINALTGGVGPEGTTATATPTAAPTSTPAPDSGMMGVFGPSAAPPAASVPAGMPAGATRILTPPPAGTQDGTYVNARGQTILIKDGVAYLIGG